MSAYLCQIDGWAGSTPTPLRMASHDDDRLCHLNGQTWWPSIVTLPKRRYDFFDGAFGGGIVAPTGSIDIQVDALPALPGLALHDARFRLWKGELGAAWSAYELLVDGRVQDQPTVADGRASISFGVDDSWLDQPLLSPYAGTGGLEGGADLKGQPKPLLLGAPRYAPGVLIDTIDNVWQLSAYGAIEAVEVTFARLIRYGSPLGDAANLAALKAMAIGRGQWATCLAQGLVRFGAPPDGPVCFHVQGDKAGPGGWVRRAGGLIGRIANMVGASGRVSSASLSALDAARPWNLSPRIDGQVTARDLIQRIAASVNAVAVMGWNGTLYVHPIGIGSPSLTLAADGSALPPVAEVRQLAQAAPFWRLAQQAEVTQTVHALSDVAFAVTPVDRGAYNGSTLYREGDMVTLPDQSRWRFVGTTPAVGSLPADGNANWSRMTDAISITGAYKLVSVANMTIAGDTVTKSSGGTAWNGKARTVQAFIGAVVNGRVPVDGFIALTTDPEANASYDTLDYGLQKVSTGRVLRYRNGASLDIGGWSGNPLFSIEHDGREVRYLMDGVVLHTHAPTAPREAVYGAFALQVPGTSITDIGFASAGLAGSDGAPGAPGSAGAPGAPGADGVTHYNWIAFADSPDGTVNFTTGAPNGRAYRGEAVNKTTATESINPADYVWSQYTGTLGFGVVTSSGMQLAGDRLIRTVGYTGSWDQGWYSSESFTGGCSVSGRLLSTNTLFMLGLNSDPTADNNYTSLDHAIYVDWGGGAGAVAAFENGTAVWYSSAGFINVGDVISIHYDGKAVRYAKNGTVFYTNSSLAAGLTFWMDGSVAAGNGTDPFLQLLSFNGAGAVGATGAPGAPGAPGADGSPGAPGADGTDGSLAEAIPSFFGVNCYSGGTPKPGQLASIAGQLRLRIGSAVVTSGVTYSVVSQTNMPGISIDGAGNFGGVTAILDVNASAVLKANYAGVDYPVTIAARRIVDGSAANSGSAAITNFPASSSYAAAAAGVTLSVANGAWLYADASCTYGPTSSGTYTAQIKLTYQNITDGGAEMDFPTTAEHPATGGAANTSDPDGVSTNAAIQNTSGGTKSFTIRAYARRAAGGGSIPSGNLFGSLNGSVP